MFPEISIPEGNILLSMKTIAEWLTQEITKAGITQAELARKSGVSTAQIARAVNGTRGLSENSITAIAEALKIPPEQAFRVVGFLPPVPAKTEQSERLLGHNDLTVLRRYLAQTDSDLREAHARASPADNWRL